MAPKSFEFKIGADTSDFIKNMNAADKAVWRFNLMILDSYNHKN